MGITDTRRETKGLRMALAAVAVALMLPGTALATAPTATTAPATNVTSSSADLNGAMNAQDKPANWHFEYATDADFTASGGSYNNSTPTQPLDIPLAGPVRIPVLFVESGASSRVTGLASSTTYHFRLVVSNADGTTSGGDLTFTTGP